MKETLFAVVETLGPLVILIALGAVLAHLRFLGREFMADLNKLAFWIALPALLFTSSANASAAGSQLGRLLAVLLGATLLITLLAWGISRWLQLPGSSQGTLMQSAFRGNLAYIGIPVLASGLNAGAEAMATAVLVMVLLMAFYNILAVMVFQWSNGDATPRNWGRIFRSILTNPLLIAGGLGILVPLLNVTMPTVINKTFQSLGAAAIPVALLCIGGSLATLSLPGRRSLIITAAGLKVAVLPLLVFGLSHLAGLGEAEQRIGLVLAACPTAAAAYIVAKQMGGDETLASGSIALSTLLSAVSLALALMLS